MQKQQDWLLKLESRLGHNPGNILFIFGADSIKEVFFLLSLQNKEYFLYSEVHFKTITALLQTCGLNI